MKRNTRKVISICVLASLIVSSNSFISAAEVVGTISTESVKENLLTATISEVSKITSESTPSNAVRSEELKIENIFEVPTQATSSDAITSNATSSDATPSDATPSNATPSDATPIEKVEFQYVRPGKDDIPDYYNRINSNKIFYTFTDRNNTKQYRIYGYYEDASSTDWYECNENGEVDTSCQFIDIDWEYYNQAPYIYENINVTEDEWQKLYDIGYGDWCFITRQDYNNFQSYKLQYAEAYNGKKNIRYDSKLFMYAKIVNSEEELDKEYSWYIIDKSDNDKIVNAEIYVERGNLLRASMLAASSNSITVYGMLRSSDDPSWYPREQTVYANNGDSIRLNFETNRHPGTGYLLLIVHAQTNQLVGYYYNGYGPASYSFTFDGSQAGDYICYTLGEHSAESDSDGDSLWYSRLNDYLRRYGITDTVRYDWQGYTGGGQEWQAVMHVRNNSKLVTFTNWDGTVLGKQEVKIGNAATPPSNPIRTGYSFIGWDKAFNNITEDTIVTAKYASNTYTVNYNGNGATGGNTEASLHSYDSAKKLTANRFSNKYYSFKNWNTKPDGTGTSYTDEQTIMNLTSKDGATITLYAQWNRSSSLVIFEDWDGNTLKEQEVNMGGTAIAPNPKRIGYTFLGWDKSLNNITDHTIIKAQYIINNYNLQLLGNGGTVYGNFSKEESVVYNSSFDQLLLNGKTHASRVGYTFNGWYTLSTGGSSYSYSGNRMPATDLVIYAQWDPNIYEVRFDSNHARWDGEIYKEYHTYDTELGTLPAPEIKGWSFAGWWTEKNGAGEQINDSSMVEAHDVTYYGYWIPKTYQIHFDKNLYAIKENPVDKTVTYDNYLGELPVLSAEGYTFSGWYTEPENGEKVDEETPVAMGDQTYYAHWKNKSFNLKLITQNVFNLINYITVFYDLKIGELPIPKLEDFKFRGWYLQPYSDKNATPSEATLNLQAGILQDTATPSEALKIDKNTIYRTATESEAYAYFDLVFREEPGNRNRRCGIDGEMDTDDDNFYFNGQDGVAGSSDDCKIESGEDKIYGTSDDYYLYKGYRVYPGPGKIFGDLDDFMDLEDGTNLRFGASLKWFDTDNILVNNGYDKKSGTSDDWIWENKELNIVRRSGPDGIFFTSDDEIWWNGPDGIPGNEDDKLIHKGKDGQYGTIDDFIDNGDGNNTRPGPDLTWGTEDDEIWLNGPDGIPGNEDDMLKVVNKNNSTSVNVIQPVNVLPMHPSIKLSEDSNDNRGIVNKKSTPQINNLKQSNYEGLGGDVEEATTLIPEEEIQTSYIKDEITSQPNLKIGSDKTKSFWSELFNWLKEKKDEFAVLLFFLVLLAILYEGSRRKNKGKLPSSVKNKKNKINTNLNDTNVHEETVQQYIEKVKHRNK